MTTDEQNQIYREALRAISLTLEATRNKLTAAPQPAASPEPQQQPQPQPQPQPPPEGGPKSNALDGITMPFGKCKGERVDGLDTDYLDWLWNKDPPLYGDLAEAVKKVLERRGVDVT